MDVVDGRLRCNYEQAIVLASYSLQAEFGDHDTEKHTLEYLQDFPLLPKPMMAQLTEDRLGKMPKFERNSLLCPLPFPSLHPALPLPPLLQPCNHQKEVS